MSQPGGMPQPGEIPHAGGVPQFGGTPQPAERQETGGPNRTPRSEIGPAVSANRNKEPVLLLDLSTSMDWGAADERSGDYPDPNSRRAIVIGALHGLVRALEAEDSEAAAEQAGGSDELGGLMTHGFANGHVEIGDLNSSNLERRLNSIQWGGRTYIMPAWRAALADYDEEFGDRDPDEQPVMEVLVLTDGEADDWMEFEPVLEKATAKRVFVVAIVGSGPKHDATLRAYQEGARKNQAQDKFGKSHVNVVSFDSVTDPGEIAADLVTLVV
ncbi:MAG TPA: hypothetical protein VGR98_01455 [Streptosporangiaceae bacterium]|nr:hypothetical protein [Streptosporangiaceae bacterium]